MSTPRSAITASRACRAGASGVVNALGTSAPAMRTPTVPIMPGDYGLIQYGQFAIFFQYTSQPVAMSQMRWPELMVLLAIVSSATFHGGIVGLLRTLMTPGPLTKPVELSKPPRRAKASKPAKGAKTSRKAK